MISEITEKELRKVDDHPKPSTNKDIEKKKINPITKQKIELVPETLKLNSVKRFKAFLWEYVTPPECYDGNFIYEISLKELRPILKTTRKFGVFESSVLQNISTDSERKDFAKYIKGQTSMRDISLYCTLDSSEEISEEGIQDLRRGLKSLISLKRVNMQFSDCPKITDKEVQKISRSVKELVNLQYMNLSFSQLGITDKGITSVGRSLKRLSRLENLELQFSGCEEVTGAGLKNFGQALKNLPGLKNANLTFSSLQINDGLGQCFKDLVSLESLRLHFYSYEMMNEGMLDLANGVERLHHLKNLKISLSEVFGITVEGMSSFGKGIDKLAQLENLDLAFHELDITGQVISDFGQRIGKLLNLKSLSLSFQWLPNFTDEGMSSLGQGIGNLVNLESLNLKFSSVGKITSEGYLNFGQGIEKLVHLKGLSLDFQSSESSDEKTFNLGRGITKLNSLESLKCNLSPWNADFRLLESQQLSKGLLSLQNIELDFHQCWDLTDTALESLGQGLATVHSLKSLKLKFFACEKLSGEGMKGLGEGLKSIFSLKTLDITFDYCQNFGGKAMEDFGDSLKTLTDLENLSLYFDQCYEFSPIEMQGFGEKLGALTSLHTLKLVLDSFAGFDDIGMQGFVRGLKYLGSLETLSLNIASEFTDEGIEEIGESFKSLTSLKNLVFQTYGSDLTDFGVKCLIEGLENLPLEKIELKFCGDDFSAEILDELGQCLDKISSLKSISLYIRIRDELSEAEKKVRRQTLKTHRWWQNAYINFS